MKTYNSTCRNKPNTVCNKSPQQEWTEHFNNVTDILMYNLKYVMFILT